LQLTALNLYIASP